MSADVLHDDEVRGPRSIQERAENGESGVPEEELFPLGSLPGDDITPQTLVKRGLPTTLMVSLMRAKVPFRGKGLADPNRFGRALVQYLPAKVNELPLREDKGDPAKVTGWELTQELRVVHVATADEPEDLIRTEFQVLLAEDAKAAAALFAELRGMMVDALGADAV